MDIVIGHIQDWEPAKVEYNYLDRKNEVEEIDI